MCVVVRYYDIDSKIIVTRFWDLIQVYDVKDPDNIDKGATAQNLFTKCIESFEKLDVDTTNIIGFASDGCSTMMGSHNSVSSKMKDMFPGIFIMKCICHSLHLCCSEACKTLPRRCEDLARNIFNFFCHSSKRQSQYVQFQQFLNIEVHKLLHPSQTRWLSLFAVVQRIIEQWDALNLYFTEKWLSEKLVSAENIHFQLNDPFTKAYFYFLEWILPKFTGMNQYFQSEHVVINTLNEKMELVYTDLLVCYMKRDYVTKTPLHLINPNDENQFLKTSTVYLGVKVLNQIKIPAIQQRKDLLKEFYNRCINFIKTSCLQIKKRYDFSNPILPLINMLTPSVVLSSNMREKYPSITCLSEQLHRIVNGDSNIQKLDDQWRTIVLVRLPNEIQTEKEPDKFWTLIKELETGQFLDLAEFALAVLSLPHSNASCERVFSKINCIKTKSRNRLITAVQYLQLL